MQRRRHIESNAANILKLAKGSSFIAEATRPGPLLKKQNISGECGSRQSGASHWTRSPRRDRATSGSPTGVRAARRPCNGHSKRDAPRLRLRPREPPETRTVATSRLPTFGNFRQPGAQFETRYRQWGMHPTRQCAGRIGFPRRNPSWQRHHRLANHGLCKPSAPPSQPPMKAPTTPTMMSTRIPKPPPSTIRRRQRAGDATNNQPENDAV